MAITALYRAGLWKSGERVTMKQIEESFVAKAASQDEYPSSDAQKSGERNNGRY